MSEIWVGAIFRFRACLQISPNLLVCLSRTAKEVDSALSRRCLCVPDSRHDHRQAGAADAARRCSGHGRAAQSPGPPAARAGRAPDARGVLCFGREHISML